MNILVTGGCGFIFSNFIRYMLGKIQDGKIVNLDKLTYASDINNLRNIEKNKNYKFYKGDICDKNLVGKIIKEENITVIINGAAETHVDRSIISADSFVRTDVLGTSNLLEAARKFGIEKYIQISTDEVYGSIKNGSFKETYRLNPSNPYSASKASADLICNSYFVTYGLPIIITRSSNNFGPYQHPEKLIPKMIINAVLNKELPIYGSGKNVRDWLFVEDNCDALYLLLKKGNAGEIYNISAGNEKTNIEITKLIVEYLGKGKNLIKFVNDRPGHDFRYSISSKKIRKLGWKPLNSFEESLRKTINWYRSNDWWWKKKLSSDINFHEKYKVTV